MTALENNLEIKPIHNDAGTAYNESLVGRLFHRICVWFQQKREQRQINNHVNEIAQQVRLLEWRIPPKIYFDSQVTNWSGEQKKLGGHMTWLEEKANQNAGYVQALQGRITKLDRSITEKIAAFQNEEDLRTERSRARVLMDASSRLPSILNESVRDARMALRTEMYINITNDSAVLREKNDQLDKALHGGMMLTGKNNREIGAW